MNFYQIFTLLAENSNIGLNTDILETGVLNIISLLIILFLFAKENFFPVLETRQDSVISSVEGAQKNLQNAENNLIETKNLLNQTNLVIAEIRNEVKAAKKAFLLNNVTETKEDIRTRFGRVSSVINLKERQTIAEIKQQIISLVLKRMVIQTKQTFETQNSALIFLNDSINKLQALEGISLCDYSYTFDDYKYTYKYTYKY